MSHGPGKGVAGQTHSRRSRVREDDGRDRSHATQECSIWVECRDVLLPRSGLRGSRGAVLDADSNGDDHDRCHDRHEADPAQDGDLVEGLDGGESECADHGDDHPSDGTSSMRGDGVECNGNCNEAGTAEEDHEERVGNRVKLPAPFAGEDVSDTVHTVDLGVISLELPHDHSGPGGQDSDDNDDWVSAEVKHRYSGRYALRDPGTPPVADSTVGIASTPKAMIVFNMTMQALILLISQVGCMSTGHSPSSRLVVHVALLVLSEHGIVVVRVDILDINRCGRRVRRIVFGCIHLLDVAHV